MKKMSDDTVILFALFGPLVAAMITAIVLLIFFS